MCGTRWQDTFQRAKQWVKELQRQGNPNIVIALAGNKSDLNSKRKVEPEVNLAALLASAPSGFQAHSRRGRKLSHMRMTTASSSWRRVQKQQRMSMNCSWLSVCAAFKAHFPPAQPSNPTCHPSAHHPSAHCHVVSLLLKRSTSFVQLGNCRRTLLSLGLAGGKASSMYKRWGRQQKRKDAVDGRLHSRVACALCSVSEQGRHPQGGTRSSLSEDAGMWAAA